MYKKKIAIYVEGQTEQIFVDHLIKTWWNYSGIEIQNIVLFGDRNSSSKLHNFSSSNETAEDTFFFLIIDVQGFGSLPSAIADRANSQHENGFEIIGLRDLDPDHKIGGPHTALKTSQIISENINKALTLLGCLHPEKIEVFFAIMEIETWWVGFIQALAKWTKLPEKEILRIIDRIITSEERANLEIIAHPSSLIEKIGASCGKTKPKSFHDVMSFVSPITCEDIQSVFYSNRLPSFTKFWSKIISFKG